MKNFLIGLLALGSVSVYADTRIGDVTCHGRFDDNREVTVKFSSKTLVAKVKMTKVLKNGWKMPLMIPRKLKMTDAMAEFNSKEEYYFRRGNGLDLTLQYNAKGEFMAKLVDPYSEYLLGVYCK